MCCHSCGHWNRCPRCTGNICEMCGEDLAPPPNEKEETDGLYYERWEGSLCSSGFSRKLHLLSQGFGQAPDEGEASQRQISPLWFATASEAEAALVDYAKERGWKQEITL